MLQLWKARQGRKAAVAVLAPLIAQSEHRVGAIPEWAWHDAYVMGFLSMLASLEAWRKVGPVSSQALGLIQADTLAELSGEVASVLGEEICILCMESNLDFAQGCEQAANFHAALEQSVGEHLLATRSDWPFDQGVGDRMRTLWVEAFESHLEAQR